MGPVPPSILALPLPPPVEPPPPPPDFKSLKYKLATFASAAAYHGSPTYTCTFLNTLRSSRGMSVQAALLFTHTDTVLRLNTIFTRDFLFAASVSNLVSHFHCPSLLLPSPSLVCPSTT